MEQERWPAAAAAFAQAAQVRPTPGLFYHVAYCRERSGQFLKAREGYLAARELSQSQPAPDVDKLLPEALARVESELGRLLLTGAPPSARLVVDGAAVSPAGELWLEPGEHELHLTADGYQSRRSVLRLARGQTEKVELSLQRSGTPPTAEGSAVGSGSREHAPGADSPEIHSPIARETVFWGGVSLGLGGTTLGVVGLVQMQEASTQMNVASDAIKDLAEEPEMSACPGQPASLETLCQDLSDASSARDRARNRVARQTIHNGRREIERGLEATGRIRRPGAGRRALEETESGLKAAIEELVEPVTRGDPGSPLRWTCASNLAAALQRSGWSISATTVGRQLHELSYSLQSVRKNREGTSPPDRNEQFEYINAKAAKFLPGRQPVISVDTKKKELVRDSKNAGREWTPKGVPEQALVHDVPGDASGKASTLRRVRHGERRL